MHDCAFRPAGPANLMPGKSECRIVEGRALLVACAQDGRYFAVSSTCSHMGLSLESGRVRGASVICPHHGARFDLATGAVQGPPAFEAIAAYEVRVAGAMLEVAI